MSISEIMTIVIAFHGSGFRTFKDFYTRFMMVYGRKAFPKLVSYNRFVELMPWALMMLCCFLNTRKGEITGISFREKTISRFERQRLTCSASCYYLICSNSR